MQSSPHSRASSSTSAATAPAPSTPKSGKHHQQRRQQQQQQQHQYQHQRKAQSMSPQSHVAAFANSSICASPSARNVPLPPEEWLSQLQVPTALSTTPSRPSSSVSNASSSARSSPSTSPTLLTGTSLRALEAQFVKESSHSEHRRQVMGVRVCPLQLIAAVASA